MMKRTAQSDKCYLQCAFSETKTMDQKIKEFVFVDICNEQSHHHKLGSWTRALSAKLCVSKFRFVWIKFIQKNGSRSSVENFSSNLGNNLSRTSSDLPRLVTPTRSAMLPRTTMRSVLVMAPLPWTSQMVKQRDARSNVEPRAVTQRKSRSSLQCTNLGAGEIGSINVYLIRFQVFVILTLFHLDPLP